MIHIVETPIPVRLDRYIRRLYPNITQGVIEKLLRQSFIQLNSQKTTANQRLKNGDIITLLKRFPEADGPCEQNIFSESTKSLASKLLNEYLLYSDDNLLVINKPHGLATQGGSKISLSIQDAIGFLNQKLYDMRLVHRLDKDTSGVFLIAKNYLAAHKITKAFKERLITKTYIAAVVGKPFESEGEIRSFLIKENAGVRETNEFDDKAKEAITRYKVIKTNGKFSLIEFSPKTGRMHQLRLHSLKLNCPIVGDKKYGSIEHKYMMLHSYKIEIPSSVLEQQTVIEAAIPTYFSDFIRDMT